MKRWTNRLPRLPKPFTIPIATERFAGGRGMALDVHTSVSAKPGLCLEYKSRKGSTSGHVPE